MQACDKCKLTHGLFSALGSQNGCKGIFLILCPCHGLPACPYCPLHAQCAHHGLFSYVLVIKSLVAKETVVQRRLASQTRKFGIKRVCLHIDYSDVYTLHKGSMQTCAAK